MYINEKYETAYSPLWLSVEKSDRIVEHVSYFEEKYFLIEPN